MSNDTLAVVIPVYNEEQCIEKVIKDWGETLEGLHISFNLIIINDGSKDRTPGILDKLVSKHSELIVIQQENQGHGSAVKNGYIEAISRGFDFVFQTDSDNQFTPEDFFKFWEKRNDSPAIFGNRANRKDPLARKFISFFLRKFLFDFFETDIPDANIPYRLFQGSFLKNALACLTPGIFAPNIFLSILCFKSLGSCPVINVQHFGREGQAKLIHWSLFKACIDSFWDLIVFSYQLKSKVQYIRSKTSEENVVVLSTSQSLDIAA